MIFSIKLKFLSSIILCVCAFMFVGCADNRLEQDAPILSRSNITTNGQTLTINGFENACYSKDGGINWCESNVFTELEFDKTYNVCVMYPENKDYRASKPSNIIAVKVVRPAASTPIIRDQNISIDGNRVTIIGFTNASYSADNGETWSDNNVFNDLINGKTYQFRVRIKATDTTAQGEPSRVREVTIPKLNRSAPLLESSNVVINSQELVISIVGFDETVVYSIDGGLTYQTQALFENLESGKTYEIVVKYLANEQYNESAWSNIIYRTL